MHPTAVLLALSALATPFAAAQGSAPCTKELGNPFLRHCQDWARGLSLIHI